MRLTWLCLTGLAVFLSGVMEPRAAQSAPGDDLPNPGIKSRIRLLAEQWGPDVVEAACEKSIDTAVDIVSKGEAQIAVEIAGMIIGKIVCGYARGSVEAVFVPLPEPFALPSTRSTDQPALNPAADLDARQRLLARLKALSSEQPLLADRALVFHPIVNNALPALSPPDGTGDGTNASPPMRSGEGFKRRFSLHDAAIPLIGDYIHDVEPPIALPSITPSQ